MKKKMETIISSVIALLPMGLACAVYKRLPDRLPMHYNVKGEVDNYADKWVIAFAIPVVMCVLNLVIRFAMSKSKKEQSAAANAIAGWIFPAISVIMVTAATILALK